jgi:hypothetical protein
MPSRPGPRRRRQHARAFHLDHAHAAQPVGGAVIVVADGGMIRLPGRFVNGGARRHATISPSMVRAMVLVSVRWLRLRSHAAAASRRTEAATSRMALSTAERPSGPGRTARRRSSSSRYRQALQVARQQPARPPALQDLRLALGAHLAGVALAARFVGEEAPQPQQHVAQVARVVEDGDHARAERQPGVRAGLQRSGAHPGLSGEAKAPAAPPNRAAWKGRPLRTPPARSSSRWRRLTPNGTSYSPGAPRRPRGRTAWPG